MVNLKVQGATKNPKLNPVENRKSTTTQETVVAVDIEASTSGLSQCEKDAIPVDVSAPVEKDNTPSTVAAPSAEHEATLANPKMVGANRFSVLASVVEIEDELSSDEEHVENVFVEESPRQSSKDLIRALVLVNHAKKPGMLSDDNAIGLRSSVMEEAANEDVVWSEGEKEEAVIMGEILVENTVSKKRVRKSKAERAAMKEGTILRRSARLN
ncbi:OLC1v1000984C1 [Oldenlandia corymbosa var. corymbosa]|uniref:OLC1v1000984C1 n=1 Tax=Oldenlandia corymbosa var. corymbosa TaxID=529605 RepID=A0AAV1D4L3_OLDCO|nr:OLC1v1000984C1 [Oldenlandia corymbosa var. corymbosa]